MSRKRILGELFVICLLCCLFIGSKGKISEEANRFSGTLVIYENASSDAYGTIAKMFCEVHPDVTVKIINSYEIENDLTVGYSHMYQDIASGENNIDILDISGIDYGLLVKGSDLLEPLNDFIENDADFSKENYYNAAFNAYDVDGLIFGIPRCVEPVYIKISSKIYDNLSGEGDVEEINISDIIHNTKEDLSKKANYTLAKLTRNFDGEQLFESEEMYDPVMSMNFLESDKEIRRLEIYPMMDFDLLAPEGNNASKALLYVGKNGEHYMDCYGSMAIIKGADNKELAWEFIKFALSNQGFMQYDNIMIPVNKEKSSSLYSYISEANKIKLFGDVDKLDTPGIYN